MNTSLKDANFVELKVGDKVIDTVFGDATDHLVVASNRAGHLCIYDVHTNQEYEGLNYRNACRFERIG